MSALGEARAGESEVWAGSFIPRWGGPEAGDFLKVARVPFSTEPAMLPAGVAMFMLSLMLRRWCKVQRGPGLDLWTFQAATMDWPPSLAWEATSGVHDGISEEE